MDKSPVFPVVLPNGVYLNGWTTNVVIKPGQGFIAPEDGRGTGTPPVNGMIALFFTANIVNNPQATCAPVGFGTFNQQQNQWTCTGLGNADQGTFVMYIAIPQ